MFTPIAAVKIKHANHYTIGPRVVPLATIAKDGVLLFSLKRHLVFFAAKDAAICFFF